MGRLRRLTVGMLAWWMVGPALACGYCVEDQVAATYDYSVEVQAGHEGLRIAYLGIEGAQAQRADSATAVANSLPEIEGVAPSTVRVSASPAAASFAWKGRDADLATILQTLNRRLAARGLRVVLLRTWDAEAGLH